MSVFDKLIKKYGSKPKDVLLPPPLEAEEEVPEVELSAPKVPTIPEMSEEEMGKFFNMRYDPEEGERIRKYLEQLEVLKQQGVNMSGSPEGVGGEAGTIRPGQMGHPTRIAGSKADSLLKACDSYLNLTKK